MSAIALLVSFAAAEAVLRAIVPLPLPRVLPEVRYAPHPVRRFTLVPNQEAFTYGAPVRVNERGFRETGAPRSNNGDHGIRMLALGDSFTFGLGVRDDEAWPAQLEQALARSARTPAQVINAGTISYGVFQELDLLRERGLAARPQIVIHGLYWNDFMNASAPEPGARSVVDEHGYLAWDGLTPRVGLRHVASTALSSSAFLFSLKQAAASLSSSKQSSGYGTAYDLFLKQGLAEHEWGIIEAFYRDLQALGRSNGFSVVVAIMPVVDIVTGPDPARHPYRVEARRRLERLGIPYVDGFDGQSAATFLPQGHDAHLNARGYTIAAEAIAQTLLDDRVLRSRLQR